MSSYIHLTFIYLFRKIRTEKETERKIVHVEDFFTIGEGKNVQAHETMRHIVNSHRETHQVAKPIAN